MKKKLLITLSLLVVALVLSSVAMAQGNGQGGPRGNCKAKCCVDQNGDGVCDNCICPNPCGNQGKSCGNFVDANNDGRCDNCHCPNGPCGDGKGRCVRKGCPAIK